MIEPKGRGVLDPPLEPVIGLAEGETRWRGMTTTAERAGERAIRCFRFYFVAFARYAMRSARSAGLAMPA